MQDRPTAPELLDAIAAKLFAEVREWVPRERRFQVLVLANLCAGSAGNEPKTAADLGNAVQHDQKAERKAQNEFAGVVGTHD